MNLTYEITENGYKILKDGIVWIVQENYFPYTGTTITESATLHMQALIDDFNKPIPLTPEEELKNIKQENLNLQVALAETIEKQEQEKIANQLAMAELIENLTVKGVL